MGSRLVLLTSEVDHSSEDLPFRAVGAVAPMNRLYLGWVHVPSGYSPPDRDMHDDATSGKISWSSSGPFPGTGEASPQGYRLYGIRRAPKREGQSSTLGSLHGTPVKIRRYLMNHGVATVDLVATPPTGSWAQDWSY